MHNAKYSHTLQTLNFSPIESKDLFNHFCSCQKALCDLISQVNSPENYKHWASVYTMKTLQCLFGQRLEQADAITTNKKNLGAVCLTSGREGSVENGVRKMHTSCFSKCLFQIVLMLLCSFSVAIIKHQTLYSRRNRDFDTKRPC